MDNVYPSKNNNDNTKNNDHNDHNTNIIKYIHNTSKI